MQHGIRRFVVATTLLIIPGVTLAQAPAVPGGAGQSLPAAATETLDALANTPGLTISTAAPCCKHPTLWDFLGVTELKKECKSASQVICELPLLKNLGTVFGNVLGAVGLAPPPVAPGPTPGPPDPGGPGGPGSTQGPGAVAAKIEADKAAAEGIIQNLNYLAAQNCNRYPEVIPAILQELDNPDELVRYTAVTALKKQCKDFRCSTLPATRIAFRLKHQEFCKACGCCAGCQCQEQVIIRLTDLLLDRDALGRPKEKSHRVRDFASQILAECLQNRGKDWQKQRTQQVEPDPGRGPLPDPQASQFPQTFPDLRQSALTPVDDSAARPLLAVPDTDTTDATRVVHADAVVDEDSASSRDSKIELAAHETSGRGTNSSSARRSAARRPQSRTTSSQQQQQNKAAALIEEVQQASAQVKSLSGSDSEADRRAGNAAYARLCKARLKLAILGHREHEALLLEEAETWYLQKSSSPQAMMAIASVCRLADLRVREAAGDSQPWLLQRVRFLRYAAEYFPHKSEITATHLIAAARLCRQHRLQNAERSCLECVRREFPDTDAAKTAESMLASVGRSPRSGFTRTASQSRDVSDVPDRRSETEVVPAGAEADDDQVNATSAGYRTPFPESFSAVPTLQIPQEDGVPPIPPQITGAAGSPQIAALGSPAMGSPVMNEPMMNDPGMGFGAPGGQFTQEPPPGFEFTETGELVPAKPWFSIRPLPGDVYDRAYKALNINQQAMFHPECDDDVLKPYNNRSAIRLAPQSLFNIDDAKPGNRLRLRFRTIRGYDNPDRSEYLWPGIGLRGPPLAENGLNFQDFVFYNETGSKDASIFTEIPVRLLDPDDNSNTAGPGDMVVGVKTVIIKDPNYLISSIFRTTTPIGTARRGLGNGFLSLEQGLLAVWRIGRSTHLHGEARFRYPIGADPLFAGEVVRTGIGVSRVLWSDVITPPQRTSHGLLLTTEMIFTSFLDGLETDPFTGGAVDGEQTTVNHHIGLRRMWSDRFSTGIDFGYAIFGMKHLYDFSLATEFQWLY